MKWIFSLLFWLYGGQADPQPESFISSPSNPFGTQVEDIRTPLSNQQRGLRTPNRIGTHIIIFEDTHFREKGEL
jgi:hypothetical protein